ncbi:hypothetical protein D3C86_1236040 [compost metagenome]
MAELQNTLAQNPYLKTGTQALTPGRQRAYNLYFSAPKQAKTRETRIEKYTQRILNGKGINNCICGSSKKNAQLRRLTQTTFEQKINDNLAASYCFGHYENETESIALMEAASS